MEDLLKTSKKIRYYKEILIWISFFYTFVDFLCKNGFSEKSHIEHESWDMRCDGRSISIKRYQW